MEAVVCVNERSIACLDGNQWLNDEVIVAFINIVAQGTVFRCLDPCLIQTLESYRISSYPLVRGELLFPFNMRNGTHWALAWLRILHKTIVLYDTMANDYCYCASSIPVQEKNLLEGIWRKVTDRQLAAVIVSGAVHLQRDGYNCGVYVCLYAERLCKEECTVQEDATATFLAAYRQYIKNRIMNTAGFFQSYTGSEEFAHVDVNANLCFCQSDINESSTLLNLDEAESVRDRYRLYALMDHDYCNMMYGQCDEVHQQKHTEESPCVYSSRKKRKLADHRENDGSAITIHVSLGDTWVSPCMIVQYLRKKYDNRSDVRFIVLDCDECANDDDGTCELLSLIILYVTRTKNLGVVVIRKERAAYHGFVVDFFTKHFENALRRRLKSVAAEHGIPNVSFKRIPIRNDCTYSCLDTQAGAICAIVNEHFANGLPMEVDFDGDMIRNVLKDIEIVLNVSLSHHVFNRRVKRRKGAPCLDVYEECFTIGEMNKVCTSCGALLFPSERQSACCNGGEVCVPVDVFDHTRDPLLKSFWEKVLNDEHLFYMIRPLNNLLACGGVQLNLKSSPGGCAQMPLVLQGRFDVGLCHLNPDSERACFAQLYIADDHKVERSLQETMKHWDTRVDTGLIHEVMRILKKHNPIVQSYMTMYEVYVEEMRRRRRNDETDDIPKVFMNIKEKREIPAAVTGNMHSGTLNLPIFENQIAAIYLSKDGVMPSHEELDQGLLIKSRGGKTLASHYSYNIDALTYPLLFPRGEQTFIKDALPKNYVKGVRQEVEDTSNQSCVAGLHGVADVEDMCADNDEEESTSRKETRKPKFISRREFVVYILARRGDIRNHRIIGTGKLYAQYVLHCFARIEADRLCAIGKHKTEVRSTTASALFKYLDGKLNEKGVKLGKLVNMPKTYVGSREWYQKLYSDAMAVALRLGKPDLFITFTGNQEWPEIKNNLAGKYDSWITDPFLCCRVFFLRLTELIDDIKKKEIFGKVLALHGSIEFQKRGMPHAHLLITLEEKIDTPERIDAIISAELPDYPEKDDPHRERKLRLFELVRRHMIHGPCSERADLGCREADARKCSKGYPKEYRSVTELSNGGYPFYRRRDDGKIAPVGKLGKTFATNKDVVPTNYWLLLKHECHINVEVCSAIQAFKYIFKYVFKGPDSVVFELLRNDDLMQKQVYRNEKNEKCVNVDMRQVYRLARYVSHIEAAYRILRYPMHYTTHTVISLRAHLPNEEPIYFTNSPSATRRKKSKLMAYFDVVRENERAKSMTWVEVAENFRFDGTKYVAFKRRGLRIARLSSVSPKLLELYAVRKLLLYRKGVESFEDLRTFNGITYSSFMEAAEAGGFIEKSSEWEECLRSACLTEMPSEVRRIFAHIVLYCKPSNPPQLWDMFKAEMRSDRHTNSPVQEDLKSLQGIKRIVTANGMSMVDCGLETVLDQLIEQCGSTEIPEEEENASDAAMDLAEDNNRMNLLNAKQREIVMKVVATAKSSKTDGNRLFFIYGKAGCGKTFTFNTMIDELRREGLSVIAVASTGIAATLLKGGRTAHTTFSLPIKGLRANSVAGVDASSDKGKMLREVNVIIWDEISMQTRYAVECVDKLLRDVAAPVNRRLPFGGVVMVFGGDWCQFLPVVPGGTKMDIINVTLKSSELWRFMQLYVLDENMRLQAGEEEHARWLQNVGEGKNFTPDGVDIEVPIDMCMESEEEIIKWMYTDEVIRSPNLMGSMALLTVRNCDAMELNEVVLKMTPGECVELYGVDTPACENEDLVGMPCDDEEFIHHLTPPGMPQYKLKLKCGSIVMLLRNVDVEERMCNGTRLEVLAFVCDNRMLRCRNLLTGRINHITRMPLDYADETTGIAFRRFQFPVRLSYCMTINKSQGQTFDKVGIIMRTPSFAHGSTYVALSRARAREHVRITINSRRKVPQSLRVRNVVYEEMID